MVAVRVDVLLACTERGIPSETEIHDWVGLTLGQSGRVTEDNAEVAVRVVDAGEIQRLNRRYRQQDKPTNVLSFPAGDIDGLPADAGRTLGDVVICAPVVAREAAEQGKKLADHWAHMLVHGTLHLLGFDHATDPDAAEMEALETRILAARNVTDPYQVS